MKAFRLFIICLCITDCCRAIDLKGNLCNPTQIAAANREGSRAPRNSDNINNPVLGRVALANTRLWKQQGRKSDLITINVRAAGATGDGTTDDYPAISRAIAAAKGPVKVYFPPGAYAITEAIKTNADGTVFSFAHGARIIIKGNLAGGVILKHNNCKVMNGSFIGGGQSSTDLRQGFGVMLFGVRNCIVSKCLFDAVSGVDILMLNNGGYGCRDCVLQSNVIVRPAFSRKLVQDAAGIMVGYSGTGYFHENNLIENNSVDGVENLAHGIAFIAHGKNNTITRNNVKNCLRYGIVVYESSSEDFTLERTAVTNNTVENIGTPNGDPSPYGMGIYLMKSHHSLVKGNTVDNCNINTDNSETLPSGSIALNGSTYTTVDSNIITNSNKYGIAISLAFHSAVVNNVITGVRESGISLLNTAFNTISNNTLTGISKYGLKGRFGNTGRKNYAAQIAIPEYQNLSTGQGIEIKNNKINSKSSAVAITGEDADPNENYEGNKVNKVSIHDNIFTGNPNSNGITINNELHGANNVFRNRFQ